ncbi:MAG: SWF/SNF helicase family protein, partial [Defluviitaleaceae bacterium]|nr:SWF/SNF helicase family protein [Defluviitaleaceae bacterium]
CLLFSQFTEMLGILRASLDKLGMSYFYLDGATPPSDRIDMVDRFNGGEGDVFLISLKAGGTGLNLTGADIVIHYDPWWNPSVMDQASDRAYRLGQDKAVQVFNLVAMDTLEERIMELQEKKRKLIDTVLTDESGSVLQALTDAEIEELLEG